MVCLNRCCDWCFVPVSGNLNFLLSHLRWYRYVFTRASEQKNRTGTFWRSFTWLQRTVHVYCAKLKASVVSIIAGQKMLQKRTPVVDGSSYMWRDPFSGGHCINNNIKSLRISGSQYCDRNDRAGVTQCHDHFVAHRDITRTVLFCWLGLPLLWYLSHNSNRQTKSTTTPQIET